MTSRTTEKDLAGAVERLNRNVADSGISFEVVHQNGYINLFNASHSEGFSHGNTKSELYWQVQLANKVIEATRHNKKEQKHTSFYEEGKE
jgi:hypothetical protein